MANPFTSNLNFGATITRYGMTSPDDVGPVSDFVADQNELYALMPFPSLHGQVRMGVVHMDHERQDQLVAMKKPCLLDYDVVKPDYQGAAGLTGDLEGEENLNLGMYPVPFTPVYTGPVRPLTDANRLAGRRCLSHEFGHFYAWQCRIGTRTDDVAILLTQRFSELRPHQAENEAEDFAECYRAILGVNACRGTFSDGKPYSPSPELRSLLTCAFWLAANLAGKAVHDLNPAAGGVMYQFLDGWVWRWRWISNAWQSQQWDGAKWVNI
ncbi:MAG: hypothetical protein ACAI44_37885 [Candidatus Sericytochromatia bacterium]